MSIIINDQALPKAALLRLMKKSKIGAIRHLKKVAHIGLKDAKDIITNLAKNPDYYDNLVIEKSTTNNKADEKNISDLKNEQKDRDWAVRKPIAGSHFLKANGFNKILVFGMIGFVILLLYFFLKNTP